MILGFKITYMIRRIYLTFFILLIAFIQSFAQLGKYTITGQVKNVLTGRVYLYQGNIESKYFMKEKIKDSANISNGKFSFTRVRHDNNVYGFRIFVDDKLKGGFTDMVFILPRNQHLYIDSIDQYIAPIISNNNIQSEIRNEYNSLFAKIVKRVNDIDEYSERIYDSYNNKPPQRLIDSMKETTKSLSLSADTLFYNYAKYHKNSIVTLWKLIERFNSFGYKKEYADIYAFLSTEIKNTPSGLMLHKELNKAAVLSVNNFFPTIKLKNILLKDSILNVKLMKSKITLIDFWFSHCAPCIKEFSKYKDIYKKYEGLGFSIIGVSTDDTKEIPNWKKVIFDLRLNWVQYLDENGKFSNSALINSFPTNYLVDINGKIIAKNILPSELEIYLKAFYFNQNIYDKIENKEPF